MICPCLNDGNCTLDGVLNSRSDSTVVMNCECPQGLQNLLVMMKSNILSEVHYQSDSDTCYIWGFKE